MTSGKHISEDLRWTIVRMARLVDLDAISLYTDLSRRQIFRILAQFRATGKVTTTTDHRRIGRRHHLTPDDVAVSPTFQSSESTANGGSICMALWIGAVTVIWTNSRKAWRRFVESRSLSPRSGEHFAEAGIL
jgi:hypothetical protein